MPSDFGLYPTPRPKRPISDRLSKFEDNSVSETEDYSGEHWCDVFHTDFEQPLQQAIKKASERGGLCMNCVKKGKIMVADGNCRARSLEFCKGIFK